MGKAAKGVARKEKGAVGSDASQVGNKDIELENRRIRWGMRVAFRNGRVDGRGRVRMKD